MRQINRVLVITLAVLGALLVQCSDDPTAPVKYVPSGYPVYFYDNGDNPKWYIYYPEDNYLDSAYWPISNGKAASISSDGKRIYWSRWYSHEVVVLDPTTGVRLPELMTLSGKATIEFSPDLARMLFPGDHWYLLDYQTHDTLAVDTISTLRYRRFTSDGNQLYGSSRSEASLVCTKYDATDFAVMSGDTILGVIPLGISTLTYLSDDLTRWYFLGTLYTESGTGYYFIEWNSTTDGVTVLHEGNPVDDTLVLKVTNDGRLLSFTDPGRHRDVDSIRPCQFLVFDLNSKSMADTVSTKLAKAEGDTTYFNVEEIAITPDGKYLIGMSHGGDDVFLVYNLQTLSIERWIELAGHHSLSSPLCQSKP